ncbi:ATP-binding protein [Actinomadura parmotrematis]|uniref:ATP-binding protein n=1 Tax=Actinomadura parmotrematis TaxID=2864039 RepID=A0ABS7FYJ4_9ACTN|nr:ATP-binding protein [Actinomadura parmotrematis]MBW8485510.1 ATP-binding protein [Actinomadura parmotrematis]
MELNLDLRLPRDETSVPAVRRLLDAALRTLGVEAEIRDDIQLMLTEACSNVIRHAQAGDDYTVRATIVDERCLIKVIDSGEGFEPAGGAAGGDEVDLAAESGRGVMIMKALADDVRFATFPEQGALVALVKHLRYGADTLGAQLSEHSGDGADEDAAGRARPLGGAQPELEEFTGRLFDLARDGQDERLAMYVDSGVPANLTNEMGDTLLMLAAYHGHPATVRLLAERGADLERENDRGQRPLAGAVFKKEPEVVRALLDLGADPFAGHPSAHETARSIGHDEFLAWFGDPPVTES